MTQDWKTNMKLNTLIVSSLALSGLMTVAVAQRAPTSVEFSGSGTIKRTGGANVNIRRVELALNRDRSATVTFIGDKRWTYNGTWNNYAKDDYVIDIRRAYGDYSASGTVQISMNKDQVESLTIRDGRADNTRFTGNFKVSKYTNWENPWGGMGFSGTNRGSGNYNAPGISRRTFQQLTYTFGSNGYFDIAIQGGSTIAGRYRRDDNNRLTLEIERAFGTNNASGTGTVELNPDRRSIREIRLTGRNQRGSFGLDWNRGRDWNDNDPYDGDNGSGNDDNDWNSQAFRVDTWGEGDARAANRSWSIDRATSDFRRDGKFFMTVYGDDERIPVEGRWTRRDNDTIILEITKFQGRNANGSGTLDRASSGQIGRFSLAGSVGRDRYNITFRGTGRRPR